MSDKVPDGWKKYKLGDIVRLNPYSIDSNFKYSQIVYLDTGSIKEGKITELKEYKLTDAPSSAKRLVKNNNIIYSTVRPIQRHYGIIKNPPDNMVVSNGFVVLEAIEEIIDPYFLYYFLTLDKIIDTLEAIAEASSSVYPTFRIPVLENLTIFLPSLPEQRAIASVLSSIDDKIDLLQRENKTLEAMAETLFRQWFIEEAEDDWEEVKLGDFFPVITGKKDANFATSDGLYPFFTCSQSVLRSPSYSFDGAAIILAGNGDFNVKHYVGKFEAYQRTYVLIPYDALYFGFLLTLIKYYLPIITNGYQGSVINFITKPMIEKFKFRLPKRRDLIKDKLVYLNDLYKKVDINYAQIRTLTQLRDTLLPKLMSGEVRVDLCQS